MTSVGVSGFLGNAGLSDILAMSESVLLAWGSWGTVFLDPYPSKYLCLSYSKRHLFPTPIPHALSYPQLKCDHKHLKLLLSLTYRIFNS